MAFQLSAGVSVREVNLTGYVPNIPSAKTGMVLRANSGPCLDAINITNETDLVAVFGKPTAANYQDWFQAWNFLQYASSLYVVRPLDAAKLTENAGIGISVDGSTPISKPNFYNSAIAQSSLASFSDKSEAVYFINKDVTSNQNLAVAICSSPVTFKSQLALEYSAIVDVTDGTPVVTTVGAPTLTNGSQVVLNGDKIATVLGVTQTSAIAGGVLFDQNIADVDIDAFYGVPSSSTVTTKNGSFIGSFYKAGLTFKVGTKVQGDFIVTAIANTTDPLVSSISFVSVEVPAIPGDPQAAPVFVKGTAVSSSVVEFSGTTAFNAKTGNFGVAAGDTTIALQPGFIMEAGVKFAITGIAAKTFTVASVDTTLNTIKLVSPITATVGGAAGIKLTVTQPVVDKLVIGVNFFDKVYDSGLIKKTRKTLKNAAGVNVTIMAQSLVSFSAYFDYAPNWANDEAAVVVLRKNDDGYYEKVEAFNVSYSPSAKNANGSNIFVENVFNKGSKTLYAKVGDVDAIRPNTSNLPLAKIVGGVDTVYPKKGGSAWDKDTFDATAYTTGDIMEAFAQFADPEQIDINILMAHELDINFASTIAETRKDCIAVVAAFDSDYLSVNSANDCTSYLLDNFGSQTEFDGKLFTSFGTYSAFYGNMKYQYDKYNNVNRWINVIGDVCGLYAQTDNTRDPWWAPAGTSRGIIKNAIKLAFNPNKQNRDELYVNAINPVMAISGEGSAVVWGQKTATATATAMDRVNVRRLLIHLEKSIAIASNIGIFEFNDVFTRTRLFNTLDPFLRSVKARRGLYDYKLIIDESNNTPDVIDQNGLVVDVYLQPTKVAEFIRVTAAVLPTGASFSEYVTSL
jgi:hypothetical protein